MKLQPVGISDRFALRVPDRSQERFRTTIFRRWATGLSHLILSIKSLQSFSNSLYSNAARTYPADKSFSAFCLYNKFALARIFLIFTNKNIQPAFTKKLGTSKNPFPTKI